jgi:hypothetical protein
MDGETWNGVPNWVSASHTFPRTIDTDIDANFPPHHIQARIAKPTAMAPKRTYMDATDDTAPELGFTNISGS